MKKGWENAELNQLATIMYGYTAKASNSGNGPKYLRITDIQSNSVNWNIVPHCPEIGEDYLKYKLHVGDIVFARTGATTGKSFLIQESPESVFASYLIRVQVNQKKILPSYLYNFFQSQTYWTIVSSGISGSAQGGFNASKLGKINIPIPPLSEQKQIVAKLDKAFALTDKAQANIQKNIQNAKELFQSKLNEIFSQKGDGWEEKKLEDISLDFNRGRSRHRPRNAKKLYGGNYPFVQTGDVRNANMYINSYTQTYNELGLSQSKLWPKDTICITIAANIAETAILKYDGCFPDSIIGLTVDSAKASTQYTYYLLQYFKSELQELGKGSAQDNINMGTFQNRYFPFPKLEVQNNIVAVIDLARIKTCEVIDIYKDRLHLLSELKKSILQKAFSGELTK